jgi:formylmethanofuran dehydrogenase subunit B
MTNITTTCDRCGFTCDNNQMTWEYKIVTIKLRCPNDGVNGEHRVKDLCRQCRVKLNETLDEFFKRGV